MRICSLSVPQLKHEWNHTVGLIINLRCGTADSARCACQTDRFQVRGQLGTIGRCQETAPPPVCRLPGNWLQVILITSSIHFRSACLPAEMRPGARALLGRGSEISNFDRDVRVFPCGFKFSPNPFRVGGFSLSLQTLEKAKQRAGISWILFQITAKHCFGLARLAVQQQRAAE
jgi:hypothetical protein